MAQNPPPNVKIYDRPPPRGPSPLVLVIVVLVLLLIAFVAYRALHHAAPAPARAGQVRPAGRASTPRAGAAGPAGAGISPAGKRAYCARTADAVPFRRPPARGVPLRGAT